MAQENLSNMSMIKIENINTNDLADIMNVYIDPQLSHIERIKSYIEQIKNPYCFLCNGTLVQVSFVSENRTLEESLKGYLLSLKNS